MSTEQSQHSLSLSVRNMHCCCLLPCIITLMGWYDSGTSLTTSVQLFRRSQHVCKVHESTCKVGFPLCAQSITMVTLKDERRDNSLKIRKTSIMWQGERFAFWNTILTCKKHLHLKSNTYTVDNVSWREQLEYTSNFYQHINPLRAKTERITVGHSWCTA